MATCPPRLSARWVSRVGEWETAIMDSDLLSAPGKGLAAAATPDSHDIRTQTVRESARRQVEHRQESVHPAVPVEHVHELADSLERFWAEEESWFEGRQSER